MKKKQGRPTVLNASLTKRICALLVKGSSIKSACIVSGIGERTYFDWQERGKKGETPYETFFFAATRAREQHKQRLIEVVMAAAHKDARHAEWLLERQFPNEFAPYDRRPIESEPPKPLIVTYPEGALEKVLESNARVIKQFRKLPPGTDSRPAPENNGAPKAEHYYNQVTKKIEPIEPLDEIE